MTGKSRTAFMLAGFGLSAGLFAVAYLLGATYFGARQATAHATRLERLLAKAPTLGQVTEGLRLEGALLLDSPEDARALASAASRWGGAKRAEVVAKGERWPVIRVFRAADIVYFLFFDGDGRMRDYTFVSA